MAESRPAGDGGFHVTIRNQPRDESLKGRFGSIALHNGLTLHFLDAVSSNHEMVIRTEQKEGLSLQVFLPKPSRTRHAPMTGANDDISLPKVQMMACTRPERFECQGRKNSHLRKISLMLSRDWLSNIGIGDRLGDFNLRGFAATHLARHVWAPTIRLQTLAETILNAAPHAGACHRLYLESRVLELLGDAFSALAGTPQSAAEQQPTARDLKRMGMIEEHLAASDRPILSLEELANAVLLSQSTLQRLFRAVHGLSAFEYLRRRNLELAHAALRGQRLSVKEAAYLAGYANPANFSTAYRRHFGQPPSQAGR